MQLQPSGDSGTLLARKLGFVTGSQVVTMRASPAYARRLVPLRPGVLFDQAVSHATDITADATPTPAPPSGFVDLKVCAVSGVWSGLKLVIRKELR